MRIIMTNTKHIQLQIRGDHDAVNAAIAILHALNFINGSIWSNAIRQRGSQSLVSDRPKDIVRVAARAIDLPMSAIDDKTP
jgi:hypothetical protein